MTEHGPSSNRATTLRVWWLGGLAMAALLGTVHVLSPNGFVGEVTLLSVTWSAAVAATLGARRQPAHSAFPWRCVAFALTLSAIGDTIYRLMGFVEGSLLDVSVADAFWLAAYIALVIGLSSWSVGGRGWRQVDIDALTEIGSFAIVAMIIATQFTAVSDLVSDASFSTLTRMTYTAYPILGAAALAVIAEAMISRRLRNLNGVLVSCGIALWVGSDLVSLIVVDEAAISPWLDVGWMLGAIGLAASTWPPDERASRHKAVFAPIQVTKARIVVTILPLLVPGGIEMWEHSQGRNPNPVTLFAATLVLIVLVFVRSNRLIKARNFQTAALERSRRFYTALAENSSDAVIVVDENGHVLNDSRNLGSMLGQPGVATIGQDAIGLLHPFDPDAARAAIDRWRTTTGVVADAELRATNSDGTERWFGVRAANLSGDPDIGGMVINLRDITDRKRAERELSHKVFHDTLTGLPNRALFHDRLEHALERTTRTGLEAAVVYLDLDGFKTINDSRGHEAGDQVLREVATRLTEAVRNVDTVSRHGGDEFAILIEESTRALDEAQTVADRILQSLIAPFIVHGRQVVLSASIGITVGDASCTASSMMRDADLAMYRAKTTGRDRWAVYEPAMRTAAVERLELESDLRQALAKRQFRLVYQPIVDLKSNRIEGFEALLRWDHPRIGVIEPTTFIPIAESIGAIVAIGRWVLEEACRTAAEWRRAYPDAHTTMAVNLSVRQIATPEIVEQVADALELSGFPAALLVLEMTESVLVQDAEVAALRLEELRSLGVRLAIDDFGTGYSSLSYLRQFPIDILKIDKSFTNTITEQSPMPALVRGLLDLAKTLGMKTVAEGIERDVQRDSLRDRHCDLGQGFLFDAPLNIDEATEWIAGRRRAAPASAHSG